MIGEVIVDGEERYTITKAIAVNNRPNAHLYLCVDRNGNKFVAKHFYNMHPMSNVALGKHNHYGRRRDGSAWVFDEIRKKNETHDFLVKHIARIRHNGKWIIILEFIEGILLSEYIKTNFNDWQKVEAAVIAFTEKLVEWHSNNFAHGDPHLDNVMIDPNTMKVVIIDYSQIHHPDFWYCQHYGCFDPDPQRRLKHDLDNYTDKLGDGFLNCLGYLQDEFKLGNSLTDLFGKHYTIVLNYDDSQATSN